MQSTIHNFNEELKLRKEIALLRLEVNKWKNKYYYYLNPERQTFYDCEYAEKVSRVHQSYAEMGV
jgi:hypothetical protein